MDQSFVQKFEVKCARTLEILTVTFGQSGISRTNVQMCYNRLKETVKDMILNNRQISIREVADNVGV